MTTFFAAQLDDVADGTIPAIPGDVAFLGGKVHALINYIDLGANAVAVADVIVWGELPKGAVPIVGLLVTNRSLGSSTIDVGYQGSAAALRAAGTFTATDTPTLFGKAANIATALTAKKRLQSVVAAANMPNNSGDRLVCVQFYTMAYGN
ncbi:hypothetical protein HZY97_16225 [Sphingomonas sp. R-74633]|uniref:hypothetical protein n=1 Tax=Sphingomonas sp. R-74633 TaxID=2751188 RepID=UPI0015D17F85|nr:hypothetical protein [Sphingomonas sp. R-74633]NYT42320.1 hypothetical protein [Sphingomonas sp. R-74633]